MTDARVDSNRAAAASRSDEPRLAARRVVRSLLAAAVSVTLLLALFRDVRPVDVVAASALMDLRWLAATALASVALNTLQSAETLRQTLRAFRVDVPYRGTLFATAGNLAIHALMPAATGNAGRIVYLARVHGAAVGPSTAAVVTMLWMKLGWLVTLLAAAASASGKHLIAAAALALVLVMIVATLAARRSIRAIEIAARRRGGPWRTVADTAASFSAVRARPLVNGLGHSLVAVVGELVIFWALLRGLGQTASIVEVTAAFPLCIIAAKLPITVMGLGVRETLSVFLLAGVAPAETVLAATLAFTTIEHLLPGLLGAVLSWPFLQRIAVPRPSS